MPKRETLIGWADTSWNPIHGCFKVSEGCMHCYAERVSNNYGHTDHEWLPQYAGDNVQIQSHHLDFPRSLDEPKRIFVNSMSDLFLPEELLPDVYLHKIMDEIEDHPQHAFLALTKHGAETGDRHGETPRLIEWDEEHGRWPENLYMGVSVEAPNRSYRMDVLRETDAAYKWVSFEPLVEPVKRLELEGFDWFVVGGESGENHREMPHRWARYIRDAVKAQGKPFFFKQSAAPTSEQGQELKEPTGTARKWRELPPLPDALMVARPDLAENVVKGAPV